MPDLEQPIAAYGDSLTSERELAVDVDTGPDERTIAGAMRNIEVWAKSDALAYFAVSKSRNGVDWRLDQTLQAVAMGNYEVHVGFNTGYRYIKVEADRVGPHQIEIVGAR